MPLGEIVRELISDVRTLARQELELARAEVRETLEVDRALLEGFAVAAVFGLAALVMLLAAAAWGLSAVMPGWLAASLIALACAIVAGIAAAVGWLSRASPPMARTRRTLRDDLRWARERLS
ncbi:MAG TPA: phage holin family protein [Myxococcales bacterium]|nr:phage holin family protein [Myxococcales bacterium]